MKTWSSMELFLKKEKKKLSYKYFFFIEVEMQGSKIATGK